MKRTIITVILTLVFSAFAIQAVEQTAFSGAGIIHSTIGGFKFPDGSVQTEATPDNLATRLAALEARSNRFVFLDSDTPPKPVGNLVSIINAAKALVRLPVGEKEAIFEVSESGIEYDMAEKDFIYTSSDCTGQKYASYFDIGQNPTLLDKVIVVLRFNDPDFQTERELQTYEITGPVIQPNFDFFYKATALICNEIFFSDPYYPIDSLNVDLFELYPPPFTLVEE
jgi:hypothetical protein